MNVHELSKDTVAIAGPNGRALIIRDDARLRVSWTSEAEAKEPVLNFGRLIDIVARGFCAPIEAELERVSAYLRDYQQVLAARAKAEEALRMQELADIDRRKQDELARATTIEQIDEIQHRLNDEARAASTPTDIPRAPGQIVREDWEITQIREWELARARPDCVKIVPDIRAIKALLNAGVTVPGVTAKRVINSTVRVQPGKILELAK